MHWSQTRRFMQISPAKWRPSCPGHNCSDELNHRYPVPFVNFWPACLNLKPPVGWHLIEFLLCRLTPLPSTHWSRNTWWRHEMETFPALLTLCEGNPPVTGGFPHEDQCRGALISSLTCKRLSKLSRCQWFEAPKRSLWRHRDNNGRRHFQMYLRDSKCLQFK